MSISDAEISAILRELPRIVLDPDSA